MSTGATRRRQIEAIRKPKAKADREANGVKQQENVALQERGAEAKRLSGVRLDITAFALRATNKCLGVLGLSSDRELVATILPVWS